jgi:hypothetical protein
MKINFRKSLKLIALLISSLLIATVSAVAYVTLTWTTTATVVANPSVCFIQWSDGSKKNTFNYPVNIFPSIKTVDQNITFGVENWDTAVHTPSMRWVSLTTSTNVASLNVTVYNSTDTLYTQYWASVPSFPTSWSAFTTGASPGNYTIWMEITATSGASGNSVFTFEMKVENP